MKNQKGQVLIETLIALGVAVLIIAAIVTIVIASLNNSLVARSQDLASGYAKQGMETVRNIAKTNWNSFFAMDSINYCLDKDSTSPTAEDVNGCGQNVDRFSREITIEHDSVICQNYSRVVVIVSWTDSKCTDADNLFCHEVNLESCFSDVNNASQ
ncbi:MAG: hypothetical protein V1697_03295 [Candidatus Levyibacteriota bacterium]